MPRKIKLDTASEAATALIGIATTLADYRLVHFINQNTGIKLVSAADLPSYNPKTDSLLYFPFFTCHYLDLRTDFCLIANFNGSNILIPSLKQINYFLLLQGAANQQHIDTIIRSIRQIKGIQAVLAINQSGVKELTPLLEDLELHKLDMQKKQEDQSDELYSRQDE